MISTEISAQLVLHTASGTITLDDVSQAMHRWFDHRDFDSSTPVLWDVREADIEAPEDQLEAWSSANATLVSEKRAGQKTAWVFGDARLAELAVDVLGAHDWQHRVRIFNDDMEAATAWVKSTIR